MVRLLNYVEYQMKLVDLAFLFYFLEVYLEIVNDI